MKNPLRTMAWIVLLVLLLFPPGLVYGQEGQIWIDLHSPHEGETLYAGPTTVVYSMQVAGYVWGAENPETVTVELEILKDLQVMATRETELDYDNYFQFDATVNPGASDGDFTPVEVEAGCETCHYTSGLTLPARLITLRVTAFAGDGHTAQVERHVVVDRSEYVDLPVEVVDADNADELLPGVEVEAFTRLYEWRARHSTVTSDGSGVARMSLEALSTSPTLYTVSISPTRLQGVLYRGLDPVEVIFSPGEQVDPIRILARAQSRSLSGRVFEVGDVSGANMGIWAVRISNGQSFHTATDSNGEFTFLDLPIDQYHVSPDLFALARRGWHAEGEVIDLFDPQSGTMMLMLQRSPAVLIEGSVLDESGDPLPFAQVAFNRGWKTERVMPSTRTWVFYSVAPEAMTLTASAPGYLSQHFDLTDTRSIDGIVELTLAINPETQKIPFGDGTLVIPVESDARFTDERIELSSGWLWGIECSGDVHTYSTEVALDQASFALEVLPDEISRLYVYSGSAHVAQGGTQGETNVAAGHMIDFSEGNELLPVPMDSIIDRINSSNPRLSLPATFADDDTVSTSEAAGRVAVGAAQFITLITYYSVLLILIGSPFIAIYFWRKRAK